MRFHLFTALVLLCGLCFSQVVSGVVQSKNGNPVPYAHIGIIGTQFGTISKADGSFELDIQGVDPSEVITFSSIGFVTKNIAIQEFPGTKKIVMIEDVTFLNPVKVEEKKLRKRDFVKVGRSKPTKTTIGHSGLIEHGIGGEWAVEILPLEKPMKIVSVNFHLRWNSIDSVLYRIYFYSIENDLPYEIINQQEIFYTSKPDDKWLTKYVESNALVLDKPMVVSIEIVRKWYSESGDNFLFFSYAKDPTTRSFSRENSFGEWTTQAPFPLTLFLELEEL